MAHVCAPVTAVTTMVNGSPHGVTVSAFASLSVTPPMVMFALDNRGTMVDSLRVSQAVGINILGAEQAELAQSFARKGHDRFAGIDWQLSDGVPRLAGASGWLHSDQLEFLAGGDHTIILAQVDQAETSSDDALLYFRRTFGAGLAGIGGSPAMT